MLYEYKCSKCGHKFEAFKPFATREWSTCPTCGQEANKIFSAPNWTSTWVLDGLTHDQPRHWEDPYVL